MDLASNVVLVPGSGRDGAAAWPGQAPDVLGDDIRATYLRRDALLAPAEVVLRALGTSGGHLVAHSSGAVAATAAAASHPDLVRSLVLFEPACFALARGGPEVEKHILQMSPVFAAAADPAVTDVDLATRFLTALGAPTPFPPEPFLAATGRHLRAAPPPWSADDDVSFLRLVPTLVVTGAWSPLYEEVATALRAAGARHVVLTGHEHRPQDAAAATRLLREHWRNRSAGRGSAVAYGGDN